MQFYRTWLGFCGWSYVAETFCHINYSIIAADQCYGWVKMCVSRGRAGGHVLIIDFLS